MYYDGIQSRVSLVSTDYSLSFGSLPAQFLFVDLKELLETAYWEIHHHYHRRDKVSIPTSGPPEGVPPFLRPSDGIGSFKKAFKGKLACSPLFFSFQQSQVP